MGQNIERTDFSRDSNGGYLHPQYRLMMGEFSQERYTEARGIWDTMLDCSAGERAVKQRGTDYLPMTSGMATDPENGTLAYRAYIQRAVFPELLNELVTAMSGLVFASPPKLEFPGVMEEMEYRCTSEGMSAEVLARQVIGNQLTTGRIALLLDPRDGQGVVPPVICSYNEKALINWGLTAENELEFCVFDESGYELNATTGEHVWKKKYRVCALERIVATGGMVETTTGMYYTYTIDGELGALDLNTIPSGATYPEIAGSKIDFIPVVIINSTDLSTNCSTPLMEPVAKYALAAYRNSADYELALYMTAQATTIITGGTVGKSVALGSNRIIEIQNPEARVTFLEISGSGIDKQKQAIDDKIMAARRFGVELVENGAESGTALNTRLTIKTASLTNVVLTCEEGLRRLFRMAAEWCGYNPDEVIVEINKDFRNDQVTSDDIVKLSSEMRNGAFTRPDMYKLQLDGQWTTIDSYEEWEAETQRAAEISGATAFAPVQNVGGTIDTEDVDNKEDGEEDANQ